jgi:hypothetical protein
MQDSYLRENIVGARNARSLLTALILLLAGTGFFITGLASYLNLNILGITDISKIAFIPQGITMLFYGTTALGFSFYNLLAISFNIGSGYNEFSKKDETVKLVRQGFPGINRVLFLSYDFKNLKKLKFILKSGLNPRYNILLVLRDKREIPLFPAQFLLNPKEIEKKAIFLSTFLKIPLESLKI